MKIRVLGCGGSFGSPLAWGRNGNIDINNPHNFRTRSSLLISNNNQNILIDTSPDLRDQLYKAKCTKIDAVLFTHEHSDHTAGLPDMRAMSLINKSIIGLVVILGLVFLINKIDFPAPKKEIEKIISNENFKIVK